MSAVTEDGFLGGRLRIRQPKRGYRAGMDPVLLAAAVEARAGERALELGCGVGVALLCLLHRVPGLHGTGVERQGDLAALAEVNARANGAAARIVTADVAALPAALKAESFDHVLMNPPFFERHAGSAAADAGREAGRGEALPLGEWVDVALRRLVPGGRLWMIQRAARLPDILRGAEGRMGEMRVLPLTAREGRAPETLIVTGRKAARGPFRLLAPVVLHEGEVHTDGDRHAPLVRAVLRDGAALPLTC